MKTVEFPDGGRVSALGQGTWRMGEDKTKHKDVLAIFAYLTVRASAQVSPFG